MMQYSAVPNDVLTLNFNFTSDEAGDYGLEYTVEMKNYQWHSDSILSQFVMVQRLTECSALYPYESSVTVIATTSYPVTTTNADTGMRRLRSNSNAQSRRLLQSTTTATPSTTGSQTTTTSTPQTTTSTSPVSSTTGLSTTAGSTTTTKETTTTTKTVTTTSTTMSSTTEESSDEDSGDVASDDGDSGDDGESDDDDEDEDSDGGDDDDSDGGDDSDDDTESEDGSDDDDGSGDSDDTNGSGDGSDDDDSESQGVAADSSDSSVNEEAGVSSDDSKEFDNGYSRFVLSGGAFDQCDVSINGFFARPIESTLVYQSNGDLHVVFEHFNCDLFQDPRFLIDEGKVIAANQGQLSGAVALNPMKVVVGVIVGMCAWIIA